MRIHFYKYQGTGNDFVMIDNRDAKYQLNPNMIKQICDRHFGIGADGLMLLENEINYDFRMVYYNSDGNESTMCGNGGRCITAFAKKLGIIDTKANFVAIDGIHESMIDSQVDVTLKMNDVSKIEKQETFFQLNTGSPHYVHFTDYIGEMNMKKEGALIRYSPRYKDEGINVNFVEQESNNSIFVRTYERGVEDETLSCGTGVTASALAFQVKNIGSHQIKVRTLGGELIVAFENLGNGIFNSIFLSGKAEFVFEGFVTIN